mgnify:CR=1 FL=1
MEQIALAFCMALALASWISLPAEKLSAPF